MKKIFHLIAVVAAILLCGCDNKEEQELPGSIYGVVTDKATGEPINAAGVQLHTGVKTVTGSEGQYEFTELKAGDYTLHVTKTGYTDLLNYKIGVEAGKTAKGDVQIEKLPPSLRVVNDSELDISELDFGSATDDITRSFSIFNDGEESLEWQITETALWITTVSKTEGVLQAGRTQSVILTINRDSLAGGENQTTIQITSNNGSKDLIVKATGINRALPALNTQEATEITSVSAVFHGEITAAGLPAYTERGFVYAITSMPTVENTIAKLTTPVTDSMGYSAKATGLSINTTYYVRAYAKNSIGTAYSTNEYVFKTVVGAPEVTTQQPEDKNIAAGTVTFKGTIVAVGDPAYTERGFVYGTAHNPGVDDDSAVKKAVSGSGTGVFSVNVSSVAEGSIYYVRAYATNVSGTVYGTEVSFDFNAAMPAIETNDVTGKNIGAGTAIFTGTITSLGDLGYSERGFVYASTHTPTISDNKQVAPGTGTGKYSLNVKEIAEGYTYRVRAYATNAKETVYGNEVNFDFNAIKPTLSTLTVVNINVSAGTATLKGNILTTGDPAYTERGFVYGTSPSLTIDDTKQVVSGTGTGEYSANIADLTIDQQYYVRTYATTPKETVYGDAVSFTLKTVLPSVSTQAVTGISIGKGTATFNGTVISLGDPAYTERGFVYSSTHTPTINDNKQVAQGTGTGSYSINITEIAEGYTYRVRAYATNAKETVYGNEVNFDFNAIKPTLSTLAVANINVSAGTATLKGNILTTGDPAYTERGFVYGTSPSLTVDDIKQVVSGTGTGEYNANITGLSLDQQYYVHAYATTPKETVYGDAVSFTLETVLPTVSTQEVTNINIVNGTATFNGTIISSGDPAYTKRGFVYSATGTPTMNDTELTVSGAGTGTFSINTADLQLGNIYKIRAYATNSAGISYGEEVNVDFNTVLPEVNTLSISGIDATVATFHGNIVNIGNPAYIEKGFVYSTSINPTVVNAIKVVAAGISTGNYSTSVSGLTDGTIYHVRAYATTVFDTSYGEDISFTAEQQPFVELTTAGIAVARTNTTESYQVVSWVNSNNICQSSTLGGYSDWRIPTISELSTIYQNKNLFSDLHERSNYQIVDNNGIIAYVYDLYWSSNPDGTNSYQLFSFYNGTSPGSANYNTSYGTSTSNGKNIVVGYYCRCVRSLP